MLFCSWNKLKMIVNFRNRYTCHMIFSFCFHNGMGKVKWNSRSGNLCSMYAITSDSRCRVNQCNHITATLFQLEADNQTNISASQHQDPVSRLYTVKVHHGLCGSCSNHTRKRPALEGNHIFCCSCGNNNGISFIMENFFSLFYHDFFVLIHSNDCGIQFYINTCLSRLCKKLFTDYKASDLRLMLFGAKKFMDLLKQLSSRLFILIKYNYLQSSFCCLNCR